MDKQLLKAYIKVLVEEEVKRVLPELLSEAVQQVKTLSENTRTPVAPSSRPSVDRSRLAELMGITRDGDTLTATTNGMATHMPPAIAGNVTEGQKEVLDAMNRDYSHLMKAMKLT